jgi:GNAT superfamily N-acetyltransferase
MIINIADNIEKVEKCFNCYHILRPHLINKNDFITKVQRQLKEGFLLYYIEENQKVVSSIGFRFFENLAEGKIMYIDDLITLPEKRGNGYGKYLLNFAKEYAIKNNCKKIHLDSGYHRYDAHKLYLKFGFKLYCHHFSLNLI